LNGINFEKYDDIPVETCGDDVPKGIELFADVDLAQALLSNLNLAGFKSPTPVQKHALPITLQKRDLMACAQTGSGKTAAFLFPLISELASKDSRSRRPPPRTRQRKSYPKGLILAPTRELAM
jgi:ATP-dependent RNA helicase DDX3X